MEPVPCPTIDSLGQQPAAGRSRFRPDEVSIWRAVRTMPHRSTAQAIAYLTTLLSQAGHANRGACPTHPCTRLRRASRGWYSLNFCRRPRCVAVSIMALKITHSIKQTVIWTSHSLTAHRTSIAGKHSARRQCWIQQRRARPCFLPGGADRSKATNLDDSMSRKMRSASAIKSYSMPPIDSVSVWQHHGCGYASNIEDIVDIHLRTVKTALGL